MKNVEGGGKGRSLTRLARWWSIRPNQRVALAPCGSRLWMREGYWLGKGWTGSPLPTSTDMRPWLLSLFRGAGQCPSCPFGKSCSRTRAGGGQLRRVVEPAKRPR